MNHKEYIEQSERTEKKFPEGLELNTNQSAILQILQLGGINNGNCLDHLKKHLIYSGIDELEMTSRVRLETVEAQKEAILKVETYESVDLSQQRAEALHALIGIQTEVGELAEALMPWIIGEEEKIDIHNLKEELGDSRWYEAILIRLFDLDTNEINQINIDKLKARYPEKFTTENAMNRDLDAEREILEGKG